MSEDLKAKVKRFVEEGLNKMNPQIFHEFYTQESVRHHPPSPDVNGMEELINLSLELRKSFSNSYQTIHQIVAEDDVVVTRSTWERTHTGQTERIPIPPTGKKIVAEACVMHRFKDGKCIEEWEFVDIAGMLIQLGILPSRPEE